MSQQSRGSRRVDLFYQTEFGIFRIPSEPGIYVLTAERIGYGSSRSEEFELARNEIIELVARLTIDPIAIEPVQVVGEREPALEGVLVANGFYERRRDFGGRGLPFAQFFTRDELQIEHSAYPTDVFHWIPAVRIVNGSGSHASIELLRGARRRSTLMGYQLVAVGDSP